MTTTHIDDETMAQYLNACLTDVSDDASSPESGYDWVEDHLSQCQDCRAQLSMMSVLQQHYTSLSQRTDLTDDQRQSIYDYLDSINRDRPVDTDVHEVARALIDSDDDALHEALHYQNNLELEAADKTSPETALTDDGDGVERPGLLTRIGRWLNEVLAVRAPVMGTVAATVTMLAITVMLVAELPFSQPDHRVTAYQDDAVITFTEKDKLPGIGFFTQDKARTQAFDDVSIELVQDDMIRISWPVITGAERYNLRLQRINAKDSTLLEEVSTTDNHVLYHLEDDELDRSRSGGKRYEWVLYGNTKDKQRFYANGGFVISPISDAERID